MGSLAADVGDSRRRTRRHVTGWDESRECTWRNGIFSVLDRTRLHFRRTWNELEETNDADRRTSESDVLTRVETFRHLMTLAVRTDRLRVGRRMLRRVRSMGFELN